MLADTLSTKGATGPKGGGNLFTLEKCMEFFEENGDSKNKVILKTDKEPAVECLIKDIVEERKEGQTLVEDSPKKSSGSNGIVERSVETVECRIRAILTSFEERMNMEVDARERIIAFIPEYAAYLENRLRKGLDGKVAYERIKGKKPTVLGVEFGEKVLYRKHIGSKLEKLNPRY